MKILRKTEEYNIKLNNDVDVEDNKKIKPKREKINIFEVFQAIVAALVVATVVFLFCFRVINVEGSSMAPTLHDGDKVVVSAVGYKPKVGDVVVLSTTDSIKTPIVKRIIALEGDTVDINFATGIVTVNGREEFYSDELTQQQGDIAFPIVVEEGTVFVLGDNRGYSIDSRFSQVGCVDERLIVGEVLCRIYPLGDWTVE